MKSRALCPALLTALGSHVTSAVAASGGVGLSLADCPGLDERALREHLQLELVTLQLEHADARLAVHCAAGSAHIELSDEQGPYPVRVRVELGDTAKAARERLVALAATELLAQAERAQQSDRIAGDAGRARAAPTSPERAADTGPSAPPTAARKHRPVELFAAGSVALDGAPKTTLYGASLGTLIGLGRHWSLLFDTRFERGSGDVPEASVRWSVLSGFAGPMFHVDAGGVRLSAGVGLRAGWLALDASARAPREGLSLTAPWAGAALPLRLSSELGAGVVPFVGVEGGYVLLPVRGNVVDKSTGSGAPLVEQRGPWLSASAGLGVAL